LLAIGALCQATLDNSAAYNSAAYNNAWRERLKADRRVVVFAATQAERAGDSPSLRPSFHDLWRGRTLYRRV